MRVIRPFQLDISTMSFWGLKSPDQRAPLRRMGFFRFQQVNSIILQSLLLFVGYKSFSYRNSSFQSASCNIRSSFAVYNVLLHWSGPLSSIVFIQVQTRPFHFFCVRCGPDPCIHCISLGLDCKKIIWERGSVTPPCVSTCSRTQYCTLYSASVPLDHYIRRCLNYFNFSTSRIYFVYLLFLFYLLSIAIHLVRALTFTIRLRTSTRLTQRDRYLVSALGQSRLVQTGAAY